jgi:hypothetical protein
MRRPAPILPPSRSVAGCRRDDEAEPHGQDAECGVWISVADTMAILCWENVMPPLGGVRRPATALSVQSGHWWCAYLSGGHIMPSSY